MIYPPDWEAHRSTNDRVTKWVTIITDSDGRQRTSTDSASLVRHAGALAARICTWLAPSRASGVGKDALGVEFGPEPGHMHRIIVRADGVQGVGPAWQQLAGLGVKAAPAAPLTRRQRPGSSLGRPDRAHAGPWSLSARIKVARTAGRPCCAPPSPSLPVAELSATASWAALRAIDIDQPPASTDTECAKRFVT